MAGVQKETKKDIKKKKITKKEINKKIINNLLFLQDCRIPKRK
jgi:hypothetical protein